MKRTRFTDEQIIGILNGTEAAYLALSGKGLKGHKPSLLEAIRIMLEVSSIAQAKQG